MSALSIIVDIVLILVSIILIVTVLMQEGQRQGLGAIGGGAETFFGKNKARSIDGKLQRITRIAVVVFVVLALLATWLNSRTYSVTYLDENGKEFDRFSVDPQGKVTELFQSPELKHFSLSRK